MYLFITFVGRLVRDITGKSQINILNQNENINSNCSKTEKIVDRAKIRQKRYHLSRFSHF